MGRRNKKNRKPWEGFWNKGNLPAAGHMCTVDNVASGICNPADPNDAHYDEGYGDEYSYISGNLGGGSSYDYSWDKPVGSLGLSQPKKGEDKRPTYYDEYEKTGVWHGYGRMYTPTLDYRYIQQMANLFALKYNVRTKVGATLAIDLENKVLTYNPTQLMYGTKAQLIASLLHEIGHLRHSTQRKKLTSTFLKKYRNPAFELINAFEDFRVDTLMRQSYEGADDIYDAAKPSIKQMAEKYVKMGALMQLLQVEYVKKELDVILSRFGMTDNNAVQVQRREEELQARFGAKDFGELIVKLREMQKRAQSGVNFFSYLGGIVLEGYGEQLQGMPPELIDYIDKTKAAVPIAETAPNEQAICDLLDKDVFPIVDPLLRELIEGSKSMQQAFGKGMARAAAQYAQAMLQQQVQIEAQTAARKSGKSFDANAAQQAEQDAERFDPNGDPREASARNSGHSEQDIPSTWAKGDYKPLRDSVESAIRQLINKLTFLRRQEATAKYQQNQRRGKLNTRSIYRHATGSQRLFKKVLPNTDTLSSFAFSIMVDTSGSMGGDRMVHATRGLVLLSEVFEAMQIPYEIRHFDDNFHTIKKFDDVLDDGRKKVIGGMARANGGGTNFYKVFRNNDKEILSRPEKNKFVIILSDGGVGGGYDYQLGFDQWEKQDVKPVGIGLNCGDEVVTLCRGQGFATDEAQELPDLFAALLKKLIFKR